MKLTLSIINSNKLPEKYERSMSWENEGGSIGRLDSNDWALYDLQSKISRVHARISFADDTFFIEDLSTNGVFIKDRRNRIGQMPQAISDGDIVLIGHYKMEAAVHQDEIVDTAQADITVLPTEDSLAELNDGSEPSEVSEPVNEDDDALAIPEKWWDAPASASLKVKDDSCQSDICQAKADDEYNLPSTHKKNTKKNVSPELLKQHLSSQKFAIQATFNLLLDQLEPKELELMLSNLGEDREAFFQRLYDDVFCKEYESNLQLTPELAVHE
ncbi:MAG: FHA domain-containing protein [Cellvibrionaceae bacterium]